MLYFAVKQEHKTAREKESTKHKKRLYPGTTGIKPFLFAGAEEKT